MSLPWFVEEPNPDVYLSNNFCTLDFETTNIEHGSPYAPGNRLILACWNLSADHPHAGKGGRSRSHFGSEFEQSGLLADIRAADFVVCHFSKFEAGWLSRCGLDLREALFYCTQIGEYVWAGNRDLKGGLGLEATCARYGIPGKGKLVSSLIAAGVCPSEIPGGALLDYCETDVERTESVFLRQRERLAREGLLPVAYCRNLVTPVLVDIESRGMCLDPSRVKDTYAEYSLRYTALLDEFEKLTGGINPKSGKQMREYLYEKLKFTEVADHRGRPMRTKGGKKGAPQARTDKKVLPLLKASTPEQKQFKKLAIDIAKLKTPVQNLEKMKKIVDRKETLVYATINQTVTDTHRLSSSGRRGGFQFHNFDRAFKPLFTAREAGWSIVEADAPQLEFRTAAHLGSDPVAKRDIEDGADIHAFTADILKTSRQDAKAHTFKPLYGGRSGTDAEKRYYAAFREKYKAIYDTQESWVWEVAKTKELRIASGLKFYWPDTEVKQGGYVSNTPSIYNFPIQSFATADVIPLVLVLVWHGLKDSEAFIVNTIHDSIIAEVPVSALEDYNRIIVQSFTRDIYPLLEKLYGVKFTVPLGVGVKAAEFWGEGKERKYEP